MAYAPLVDDDDRLLDEADAEVENDVCADETTVGEGVSRREQA